MVLIDATDEELNIKKTEIVANDNDDVAETYILSIGLDGELCGGARISLERMIYVLDHMIRVNGQKIYLLSPEEDAVYIYQVHLGKDYEAIRL